jgi:hypothetical protein
MAAYANNGREMPFRRIRLMTLETPALDVPAGGFLNAGSRAFKFHLVAEDVLGQQSEFDLPLIFVPSALARFGFEFRSSVAPAALAQPYFREER